MIYKRRVLKIICENCDTPLENELRFSKIDDNIKKTSDSPLQKSKNVK